MGSPSTKRLLNPAYREYMRQYLKARYYARKADPELRAIDLATARQKSKRYHKRHPAKVKAAQRRRYLKNRERDAERARKQAKEWCRRNRPRAIQRTNEWRAKHPDRLRMISRNASARRRVRMRDNYAERFDMRAVAERDNWRCHICGKKVTLKTLSFDHLIPVAHGGPHTMLNLAVAHCRCNKRRGPGRVPAQLLLDIPTSTLTLKDS